ncbi:NaeI family type II restriction endonuclease [Corynebacterium mendelii]|uniref:Restriction endonuclease n=1 Tax=Corynebacterium mendelii TaxID=2765362 RepID=A0A939DZH4_9CORY|nr:NaeI family type II restriction endonuclease [Corynebacterium mendelii]MBN9643679.1 restriction endonuclease [Corynebacterium mendelii]
MGRENETGHSGGFGDYKDPCVAEVAEAVAAMDRTGEEFAQVFRKTFDQLYDGNNTGRYRLEQLYKTEKTHFGSLIEINLQRHFRIDSGQTLDFSIAGHEVDCKYSHNGQWMLPMESFDEIVMVTQADDLRARWSIGLIRVSEQHRRTSANRDRKTGLNSFGRTQILWVFRDRPMPPNALLHMAETDVETIMAAGNGQQRINSLFRIAQKRRLTRTIVATVAQQNDYMKRVRNNGGARSLLQPEGIIILAGDYRVQKNIARQLDIVVPEKGELVSVRVVPAGRGEGALIEGSWWRVAEEADPVVAAPLIRNQ